MSDDHYHYYYPLSDILNLLPKRRPRLRAGLGGFERGGDGSDADAFVERHAAGEGGAIGAMEDIAAAGGVDDCDSERRLRVDGCAVEGVYAAGSAGGDDDDATRRGPEGKRGRGGVGRAGALQGEPFTDDEMIDECEQIIDAGELIPFEV